MALFNLAFAPNEWSFNTLMLHVIKGLINNAVRHNRVFRMKPLVIQNLSHHVNLGSSYLNRAQLKLDFSWISTLGSSTLMAL